MGVTWKAKLRYSVLLGSVLLISACAAKVIDIDKSIPKLNLSEEQAEVVEPKMAAIKEIVDTYNAEKEALEEEFNSMMGPGRGRGGRPGGMMGGGDREAGGGDRGGFRERLQEFGERRETYLSAISKHIADIKAVLNEEQLATFEKMKQPELEMPERPQRGGRGGMMGGGRGGPGWKIVSQTSL